MTKVSDNFHADIPARMADGRHFTDYRANCILNNGLSKNMNSWEYRLFLTKNGSNISGNMVSELEQKTKCSTCKVTSVLPVKTVQNCNRGQCSMKEVNPDGLGLDRGNTYQ